MFTIARPMANDDNRPAGASLAICRYCGRGCWRMPNEPANWRLAARPACTACALRRGTDQRDMDAALTVKVVDVRLVKDAREFVYVGRKNPAYLLDGHPLANPFPVRRCALGVERRACVERYAAWLAEHPQRDELLESLRAKVWETGRPLGCWCGSWPENPELACHAVVLAVELNRRDRIEVGLAEIGA